MQANTNIAFKEWSVVVDALGHGEQILILRKGGIHEAGGQFHVDHHQFWFLPTQFHEAETAIIPAKKSRLQELMKVSSHPNIPIEYYGIVDGILRLDQEKKIERLAGRHIWTDAVLRERFAFGREPGLYALLTHVYRHPSPVTIPFRQRYGGCKSWVELDKAVTAENLIPVLTESEFCRQRDQIVNDLAS